MFGSVHPYLRYSCCAQFTLTLTFRILVLLLLDTIWHLVLDSIFHLFFQLFSHNFFVVFLKSSSNQTVLVQSNSCNRREMRPLRFESHPRTIRIENKIHEPMRRTFVVITIMRCGGWTFMWPVCGMVCWEFILTVCLFELHSWLVTSLVLHVEHESIPIWTTLIIRVRNVVTHCNSATHLEWIYSD